VARVGRGQAIKQQVKLFNDDHGAVIGRELTDELGVLEDACNRTILDMLKAKVRSARPPPFCR
jgi:hypothetical protein